MVMVGPAVALLTLHLCGLIEQALGRIVGCPVILLGWSFSWKMIGEGLG